MVFAVSLGETRGLSPTLPEEHIDTDKTLISIAVLSIRILRCNMGYMKNQFERGNDMAKKTYTDAQ